MAVIQPDGSAVTTTSTVNNTGRFKGTKDSSITSGVLSSNNPGRNFPYRGNVLEANNWLKKALSSGTLAYFSTTKYIIRRVTTTISGVANTFLRSAGTYVNHRSINVHPNVFKTTRTASAVAAGYWDIYSASFSSGPTTASDTFASDDAGNPSLAVPGELVYKYSKPLPVQDEYEAKVN